jgi:outer membrane cobalamin receptor
LVIPVLLRLKKGGENEKISVSRSLHYGLMGLCSFSRNHGETVVVTASRLGVAFGKTPAKVTLLSQEEIQSSGAQSLSELISKKLPFYVKESPGLTGILWVGGMKSDDSAPSLFSRVLILINGHPAGSGNLDRLPFSAVERIEVLEGPASALYGSGALSGVVNIITRKKNPQRQINASAGIGSFDFQKAGFSADFSLPEIFYGVIAGGAESRGDYQTQTGQTYRNTGYEKNQAYAGFFFLLPSGFIESSFSYLQGKKIGNPGTLAANDPDDYSEILHFNFDARWRHFWQGGEVQASGYWVSDEALNVGKDPNPSYNWKLNQTLSESGLSLMARQTLAAFEIRMGASGDLALLSKQSETGSYNEPKPAVSSRDFFLNCSGKPYPASPFL